jgi:phosphoribosylformylglycinamidine synthase
LALVAMGGELGMDIHLKHIPSRNRLSDSHILFSESAGRFVVTVAPERQKSFEKIFSGMKIKQIGRVTESPILRVRGRQDVLIIEEGIAQLKDSWNRPFGGLI